MNVAVKEISEIHKLPTLLTVNDQSRAVIMGSDLIIAGFKAMIVHIDMTEIYVLTDARGCAHVHDTYTHEGKVNPKCSRCGRVDAEIS